MHLPERKAHAQPQAAHTFHNDDHIGGNFSLLSLLFVDQREILVRQQFTTTDNNQLIIILILIDRSLTASITTASRFTYLPAPQ